MSKNIPLVSSPGKGGLNPESGSRGKILFMVGVACALSFGWVTFPYLIYREVKQPLQFSHRVHTGDNVALKCEDCHAYDADGRFAGIPATDKCLKCHSHPQGVSPEDRKLDDIYIWKGRAIPWVIYSRQPENVHFSHATHTKLAGIKCQTCHFGHSSTNELRPARFSRLSGYSLDVFGQNFLNAPYTPSRGMRMDDCSNCHKERGVKDSCIDCHK